MELEKAKKLLKEMKDNCIRGMMKGVIYADDKAEEKAIAIETILKELEDSISKKKIKDKIKQLNSEMKYCARQNGKTIKLGKIMALQELLEEDK